MKGRWRLFRQEAGRDSGPPAWVYAGLFTACMLVGVWSARTFDAVVIWPANGVLLAALLQLPRRKALPVLAACLAINLATNVYRGDPQPFLWLNAVVNLGQVMLAGVVARRVCGAALDLRRPRRLANFVFLAVAPAVLLSGLLVLTVASAMRHYTTAQYLFTLHRFFAMEVLGLLIVAPALLMLAKWRRFRSVSVVSRLETVGLLGALAAVSLGVFLQSTGPLLFAIFPVLVLCAFRLSPMWTAVAVMIVALVGGAATLTGHGPATLLQIEAPPGLESAPAVMWRLQVYYLFMFGVVTTALPINTVMSARRRLMRKLERRTEAAEAARRRAEAADAAKSRFLALMSHEMRTPLNGINGYAELLARRTDVAPEAHAQIEQVQRSGEALLMLVEDVLEVSRGDDAVDAAALSLARVIEAAAAPARELAAGKGLSLDIEVRPDARPAVVGDARRLRQAVHHLIGNAAKFTEQGFIRVVVHRLDDEVLIAVSDSGCGLDEAGAEDLFKPFVQGDDSISRSHIGAGVGLALVRRHARLMGGDVTVRSRPGEGATFTLRLPMPTAGIAEPEPEPQMQTEPADVVAESRPPRVLVVDDHPTNREVARLMLMAAECEVVEAADGDEAIRAVEAEAFDLVLMDVRMPRVDGLAATRAIRAMPGTAGRTPILAVTADAMPEDAARCMAAGMDGHLAKPISHAALYAAMDQVLSAAAEAEAEAA